MKIVCTFAFTPDQYALIEQAWPGCEIAARACRSTAEIAAMLDPACEVLVSFRIPADFRQRAPRLRWLQLLSAGAEHILNGPLAQQPPGAQPLEITTASGIHAVPIAEYVIGSILAFTHKFHFALRAQLRRDWVKQGPFMTGVELLRGRTIGIVGYGSIGRETARLARAFGMDVLALKRDPASHADDGWMPEGVGDPDGSIPRRFYGPDERLEMLAASDVIVVTLPATSATRKFIGTREFAAMKPGAYIVNIGRGEVIDESAMTAALREKRIAGAGLDVFEREPLPADSPLWDMEEAILTPHISGACLGYMNMACEVLAANLRRLREGRALLNRVDLNLGY